MPWFTPTLRTRREQTRDDINGHVEGADARVPHSVLRELSDATGSQTNDLDEHLAWIAKICVTN